MCHSFHTHTRWGTARGQHVPSFSVCVCGGVVRSNRQWLLLTWVVGPVRWVLSMGALHTCAWKCRTPGHGSAAHLGMEVPHTWAWKYHTPGQGSAAHLGTEVLHTWARECCTSGMEQGDYANQFPLKGDLGRTLNKSPKADQGFNTAY